MTGVFDAAHGRAQATVARLGIGAEYRFAHHFAHTPMGTMHYVDEGTGDPVLLLHGNPTWSYLYRKFIPALAQTHRVIAPDHIGFGLSDKPEAEGDYTLDAHIQNLEALVQQLDLTNITLVMQDWGGPIGLGMAARHPARIKALVVMKTFGFYPPIDGVDPDKLKLPPPLLMMRAKGIGDFLVRRLGFFERQVMTMATATKRKGPSKRAYRDIFRTYAERAGVMAFPRMIPANTGHPAAQILMQETGPYIDQFDGPAHIFWGMKDPLIPVGALTAWKKRLPQAGVTEFATARHYLQDDVPDQLIPELVEFLNRDV
ncbi:alpha/beta fold hydrolase [Jannaschia sp. CCS1]|uniref:alpha/beta fold hydrolase n=1 Tax=Jannaschia sp. (strain CCS1) TaxID=290400 RepID=UPI000053CE21|nr:alpha/beta fold hydrolase [Jannaschia sp. CCS1]ABD55542.1 alpha/beta hydrolase [Jannaschia sp. CCS1]